MRRQLVTYFVFLLTLFTRGQNPFETLHVAYQQSNYSRVLTIADSCFAKNYFKDSSLFYKGLAQLKLGNIKEAKKNCNLLLKSYSDFKEAHYLNGLIDFSDNNFAKSVDEFSLVIKNNPKHIKALYNRSVAFGMLEDYLYAIDDLSACIALNSRYSAAFYSRAYWFEYTGNHTESIKDYLVTIDLNPKNYDAYLGLAYIYQNQKETDSACRIINLAIAAGSQMAEDLKDGFCR